MDEECKKWWFKRHDIIQAIAVTITLLGLIMMMVTMWFGVWSEAAFGMILGIIWGMFIGAGFGLLIDESVKDMYEETAYSLILKYLTTEERSST